MSAIQFEVRSGGEIFIVHGDAGWEGFVEPSFAPDPDCPHCHGEGAVLAGYEPPDEFNAGRDIYDPCDCEKEVPGSGADGHPTFDLEGIEGPDGGWLDDRQIDGLIKAIGGPAHLAEMASEAHDACQG